MVSLLDADSWMLNAAPAFPARRLDATVIGDDAFYKENVLYAK